MDKEQIAFNANLVRFNIATKVKTGAVGFKEDIALRALQRVPDSLILSVSHDDELTFFGWLVDSEHLWDFIQSHDETPTVSELG